MSKNIDINQAAEYLGVSHKTVRRYVKAGKLKVVYVNGKGMYDQDEVEKLKADRQIPVHRAITISEDKESLQIDASGQFFMSHVVPTEQITQSLQIFDRYYNLQYLTLKMTMTIEEAAIVSGFSKNGLKQAAKSGTLKAIKQGGRWRIRSRDLQEYIKCLFGETGILRN